MADTVTVLMNQPLDIVFDVTDNSGKVHKVKINGNGSKVRGTVAPLPKAGAYGITPGVDADIWAKIEKEYADFAVFKAGLIKTAKTAKEEAVAGEELKTKANGFEPEPQNDDAAKVRRGRKKSE